MRQSSHEVVIMSDVLHAKPSLECVLLVPRASGQDAIHMVDNKRDVFTTVLRHALLCREEVGRIVVNSLN